MKIQMQGHRVGSATFTLWSIETHSTFGLGDRQQEAKSRGQSGKSSTLQGELGHENLKNDQLYTSPVSRLGAIRSESNIRNVEPRCHLATICRRTEFCNFDPAVGASTTRHTSCCPSSSTHWNAARVRNLTSQCIFVPTLAIIWFTQLTFTQGWPDTVWAKVTNNTQSYVLCQQSCWAVKTLNSYQLNCSAKPGRLRLDTSESVAMPPRTKQCRMTSGKGLDSKLLEMLAAFFKPSRHLVFLTETSSKLHNKKRIKEVSHYFFATLEHVFAWPLCESSAWTFWQCDFESLNSSVAWLFPCPSTFGSSDCRSKWPCNQDCQNVIPYP